MSRARLLVVGALAAVSLVLTLVLATGAVGDRLERSETGALGERLPDLVIRPPAGAIGSVVEADGVEHALLGFASAAENRGVGPLIVTGSRPDTSNAFMTADQVIQRANGSTSVRSNVGSLTYVEDQTHRHWHLLSFMTYELRRASDFKLVAPDEKTGFCLGDRYNALPTKTLPGEPDHRVYNSNCGPEQTGLLQIVEGMSVGWGDVYEAWRDRQFVEVTGIPAGTYILVHRVNADRKLKELNYANNAASMRLRLTWPPAAQGEPRIKVLRVCAHSARCPKPKK